MRNIKKNIFGEDVNASDLYNLYFASNEIQIHVSYQNYLNLLDAGLSSDGAVSTVIQLRAGSTTGRYKIFI